jgi:drug/metabolite transporter (DMT)-like permease
MVLVAGLALILRFEEVSSLSLEAVGWIVVMGIMGYPMARLFIITAISMVGATRAVPMAAIQPVIAFILGVILLGERPDVLVITGTPIIVLGLLFVVAPRRGSSPTDSVTNFRRLGYAFAIGAAATFASRDVISRHVVSGLIDPLVAVGLALAVGGAILSVFLHRQVATTIQTLPKNDLLVCALAGVFQGLAVMCLFQGLSRAPVTVVSPIYALQPLITLGLAHIFLRRLETLDWLLAIGTAVSVVGVILVILGATG